MRKPSLFIFALSLFVTVASAQAQQQNRYYIFDGKTLQLVDYSPVSTRYTQWQVWLYQEGVHIPRYTAGLQYSRWGVMEGRSPESVMEQLTASQSFEHAYVNFFGPGTWGRYTFFNPLGPIAVTVQAVEKNSSALEERYQLDELHRRVSRLIVSVQPSLENNKSEGPDSPVKEYFDQIRDVLEQAGKLHSQLARIHPPLRFISSQVARTTPVVAQAENNVPKLTATLPSVRLPTSSAWMSHTEAAGSDGTIRVEVTQIGSAASIRQIWSGGDGSMAGTVIVTTVPFEDIGRIHFHRPMGIGDGTLTVVVESARGSFLETLNSPLRHTATRVLPAVQMSTTTNSVYLAFAEPAEARDAYAYFLYHKQLGR